MSVYVRMQHRITTCERADAPFCHLQQFTVLFSCNTWKTLPAQHSCAYGESALPPGKGQVMRSSYMVEEHRWMKPVMVGYSLGGFFLPAWFPHMPSRGPLSEWGHRQASNPPGRKDFEPVG